MTGIQWGIQWDIFWVFPWNWNLIIFWNFEIDKIISRTKVTKIFCSDYNFVQLIILSDKVLRKYIEIFSGLGINFRGNLFSWYFLFSEYIRKSFSSKFIFMENIFFAWIYLYEGGESLFCGINFHEFCLRSAKTSNRESFFY